MTRTEREIREELNRLSTYRVPNSNTDLVSRKAVERVLNLVFRGCRDKEPKTDILDKIRAEIDEQIKYNTYFNSDMAKGEIIAFEWVKRKIDEYGKEQK